MNRAALSLTILVCFFAKLEVAAQTHKLVQKFILQGQNGRHSFVLHLAKGPFRRSRHILTGAAPSEQNNWTDSRRIDGQTWQGTDTAFPNKLTDEFYDFSVRVDGKQWQIPPSLYRNCYEPGIRVSPNQRIWAWVSKDGKRLTVKMHASDGAGSYGVLWHFRKNGKHSREVWSKV